MSVSSVAVATVSCIVGVFCSHTSFMVMIELILLVIILPNFDECIKANLLAFYSKITAMILRINCLHSCIHSGT